jgi:hypothetical protein
MSCIKPIAPRDEMACSSPPLSTFITARIQRAGRAKRSDAPSMNLANRSIPSERPTVCARALYSKSVEPAIWQTNGAMATMTRATVRSERSHAIGSAVARVQLFRCRLDECSLTFGPGRQGEIGDGSERLQSGEGVRTSCMITPRQSTRVPLCRSLRMRVVIQSIDRRASPRTANS